MKALTIRQPWAELIASGVKRVENRSRRTHYRGPLAIHAGKSRADLCFADPGVVDVEDLTFGAVIATADLVDCVRLDRELCAHDHPLRWVCDHAYTVGPWCWILDNVQRLAEPMPVAGQLGFFNVDRRHQLPAGHPLPPLPPVRHPPNANTSSAGKTPPPYRRC